MNNGSQYEIEIYNIDAMDIADIVTALYANSIEGDNRDEVGMYLRDNKASSVFVNPMFVSQAVAIINELGFETDEDSE